MGQAAATTRQIDGDHGRRQVRPAGREALKILPAEVSADAECQERFNREADLVASLYHSHVVGVHDWG